MKKAIVGFLLISIFLAGCSATNSKDVIQSEPRKLVQTYYESLANKDYSTAKLCLDKDYASEIMDLEDSYFSNLKTLTQIKISEPLDTPKGYYYQAVQVIAEYYATYKEKITADDGNQQMFVYVAKENETSPWKIIGIGTGP